MTTMVSKLTSGHLMEEERRRRRRAVDRTGSISVLIYASDTTLSHFIPRKVIEIMYVQNVCLMAMQAA